MGATEQDTIPAGGSELDLLLATVLDQSGCDFRGYSQVSIRRRLEMQLRSEGLHTLGEMIPLVLSDARLLERVLNILLITVTEMFRDPSYYSVLRNEVMPDLTKRGVVRVWLAGCATGEEAYSMAILLKEVGLGDRAIVYASDLNRRALREAREGFYSLESIRTATTNYIASGGKECFSDYYSARYGQARIREKLRFTLHFFQHDLVTGETFGEMDLILFRNVLIYFDRELQGRVFSLFERSLRSGGILCLGAKETIELSDSRSSFTQILPRFGVYRKH
ncbi:MAG: protein-glutamate O-methyltransferase CheR [bacterium]|nr:protein-glutamate O-methyltransferase CheR [bacterium]